MKKRNRAGDLVTQIDAGGNEHVALSDKPKNSDEFTEDPENLAAYGALDDDIDNRFSISQRNDDDKLLDYDPGDDFCMQSMEGTATEVFTGGYTEDGVAIDFTKAEFSGSRRMGGPTGGDVYGAGAANGEPQEPFEVAKGMDRSMSGHDTGLSQKVAQQNTTAHLNPF